MYKQFTSSNQDFCGRTWNRLALDLETMAHKHWNWCKRVTDQSDYAEAVMFGLYKASKTYDPSRGPNIFTYAWPAMKHAAQDLTRSIKGTTLKKSSVALTDENLGFALDESDPLLLKSIKKLLAERDYEWFMLRYVEEWTVAEIATEYGFSKPTVQTSLTRSLALLQRELNV